MTDPAASITLLSNASDEELRFRLSNVNVSIANSIRRIILSEIPLVVFRVSPNNVSKATIYANTCGMHNELVKHRLSCIPIHIKDVKQFPIKNYIMEVNVQNNTDTTMFITTKDFTIKDTVSGKLLPEKEVQEIFPPNTLTGDYIDFVRLTAKPAEEIQGKTLHLTCEFDIGTAREDGAYNAASTCAYGNTVDEGAQEVKLQQLRQKWKDEGKTAKEIEFQSKNWALLEGKRIFKPDSFDFAIQTASVYTNAELVILACQIMTEKLETLRTAFQQNEVEIKSANSTIANCYDVILKNEDYTLGTVLEYFMGNKLLRQALGVRDQKSSLGTYCGFKKIHPHDLHSLLRVAYKETTDVSVISGHFLECIQEAVLVYDKIRREMLPHTK